MMIKVSNYQTKKVINKKIAYNNKIVKIIKILKDLTHLRNS
jgi:hypothetical protein